jgi:hypothetical protein
MTYRAYWHLTAVLVAGFGIACAVLLLAPQEVAGFGVDGLLVAVTIATAQRAVQPGPRHVGRALGQLACTAALGVPAGIATAGLVRGFGAPALIIPVALVVSCPQSLRLIRRLLRAGRNRDAPDAGHSERNDESGGDADLTRRPFIDHTDDARALTDEQLCQLWQTSYRELVNASSAAQLLQLSDTRRAVLDELAARNPTGFADWLNAGARAASDPRRHMRRPQAGRRNESDR